MASPTEKQGDVVTEVDTAQHALRLHTPPRPTTLDMLFRMFGTVLVPREALRERLFRNINEDRFKRVLGTPRLPLPVTTLEDSREARHYIEIHHLAAYIDQCAARADASLAIKLAPKEEP
ncbi:MAG TPA: transcriptional regulator [Pseudomonas sp.]|nr:transcriptional regulator [Pseudomonas sp.]MBB50280.1 transcriptional regulator [Pseudomonadales bacterium]MBB50472.1 transcriptional regulator [Pseudomonadales bacterium]HCA25233.1 transcriptional regulator [Pseudomonas sp.]|tara:strand:- start:123 stop:482 length:360 start_codon:yes stop_codon:yes gene_type:complete